MNINKGLKNKNKFTKELSVKLALLPSHNVFDVVNKDKLEYNTADIVKEIDTTITKLVDTKAGIAKANGPIWGKIFRIAELKGLIVSLKMIPVKTETETIRGYGVQQTEKIEWDSTLKHTDIDQLIKKYETEIETLQDEIDKFNFTTEI